MSVVEIRHGNSPVILGFPHTGIEVPPAIWGRLNDQGRVLSDTDWHIEKLYDGLLPRATTVRATFHRYVIDANRDPSGVSLYPGQNTTGLIPETDFDARPIWRDGQEPNPADISSRLADFHQPYHEALRAEIERVKAMHGVVVLYDCHSIRSCIPHLFSGKLPDLNIGTNNGTTCDAAIEAAAVEIARNASGYDAVVNGRFRGGWTTSHYGKPNEGVHAIQMELTQCTHLETELPPFAYDPGKAAALRLHLGAILRRIEAIALQLKSDKGAKR